MERPAGEAAAGRQPDDHRHRDALAVVELRGDVDELVEAAGDEVGELHLADRPQPLDRGADRGADDRVLGQRRVEHPLGAELLHEAVGDLERAAEGADVLAEAEHGLVAAHLLAKTVGDRLQVCHLGHQAALLGELLALGPVRPRRLPVAERRRPSAKTPSVAVAGSGIGESSAFLAHSST